MSKNSAYSNVELGETDDNENYVDRMTEGDCIQIFYEFGYVASLVLFFVLSMIRIVQFDEVCDGEPANFGWTTAGIPLFLFFALQAFEYFILFIRTIRSRTLRVEMEAAKGCMMMDFAFVFITIIFGAAAAYDFFQKMDKALEAGGDVFWCENRPNVAIAMALGVVVFLTIRYVASIMRLGCCFGISREMRRMKHAQMIENEQS